MRGAKYLEISSKFLEMFRKFLEISKERSYKFLEIANKFLREQYGLRTEKSGISKENQWKAKDVQDVLMFLLVFPWSLVLLLCSLFIFRCFPKLRGVER